LQTFLRRWCRVLRPSPAAMLEIMAGAAQKSKRKVPEPRPEGRAAGQRHGSAAGVRGNGVAGAMAKPNAALSGFGATVWFEQRACSAIRLNAQLADEIVILGMSPDPEPLNTSLDIQAECSIMNSNSCRPNRPICFKCSEGCRGFSFMSLKFFFANSRTTSGNGSNACQNREEA